MKKLRTIVKLKSISILETTYKFILNLKNLKIDYKVDKNSKLFFIFNLIFQLKVKVKIKIKIKI